MSPPQRVILEVRFRPQDFHRVVLEPGRALRVGRSSEAGLSLSSDALLSELHFELAWEESTCLVRDLDSASGTLLGGQHIKEAPVSHGDWIRAGMTDFSIFFEGASPPASEEPPLQASLATQVPEVLRQEPVPLFAVLDAARSARVRMLLQGAVDLSRSLYEGPRGEVLAEMAPYLVSLSRDSRLLPALVNEGWGRSWGIYLACDLPFAEVRRHLRKLLMVEDPAGRALYFRFYDPRVLRPFLRTSHPEDARQLFGPLHCLWMEGTRPEEVLRFRCAKEGIEERSLRLLPQA